MRIKDLKKKLSEFNPLKYLKAHLANISWYVLEFTARFLLMFILISALIVVALKLPEMHNQVLHNIVGKKVYMIRDSYKSGGGTGFAVKAPSGTSYIMTNDHVCSVSTDQSTVLVTNSQGESIRRRIISHDENSDLCLVEGMPGIDGLPVAGSGPNLGETGYIVGHPRLMPTHVATGEITGAETIQVPLGPMSVINPMNGREEPVDPKYGGMTDEQCSMPKHSKVYSSIDMGFFEIVVKYCVVTVKQAYITSITIFPGNSGSPMVDFVGRVKGVAFASDGTNWGRIVPLQDIKRFLKNY